MNISRLSQGSVTHQRTSVSNARIGAEAAVIPVMRDWYAKGAGHGSMPSRVKQAIQNLRKVTSAMTKYKRTIRIQQGVIYITLLASLAVSTNAQGICVHDQLVVNSLSGRVVSQLKKGEAPIVRATIELLIATRVVLSRKLRPMQMASLSSARK